MSKVKRLRKKYRALCSKAQQASGNISKNVDVDDEPQNSSKLDRIAKKKEEKSQLNSLYDMIIDAKGSSSHDFDSRSTYSISKTIKSNLSGLSIHKKDKQRLKHELFMKSKILLFEAPFENLILHFCYVAELESSAELMSRLKKSKHKRKKKANLNDNVPLYTVNSKNAEKSDKSYDFVANKLKTPMKNPNTGKGLNKRRNERM